MMSGDGESGELGIAPENGSDWVSTLEFTHLLILAQARNKASFRLGLGKQRRKEAKRWLAMDCAGKYVKGCTVLHGAWQDGFPIVAARGSFRK